MTVHEDGQDNPTLSTFGIYTDNAGAADAEVGSTAAGSNDGTEQDEVLAISQAVLAASQYWLAIKCGNASGIKLFYDAGTIDSVYDNNAAYVAGNLPDSFGTNNAWKTDKDFTIYVTYTPSGGVAPTGVLQGPLVGSLGGPI